MKKEYEKVVNKRIDKKNRTSLRHSRYITISWVSDKLIYVINGVLFTGNVALTKIIVFKALLQMACINVIDSNYYPDGVITMKDLERLFIFFKQHYVSI